jgi:hypothetical protein
MIKLLSLRVQQFEQLLALISCSLMIFTIQQFVVHGNHLFIQLLLTSLQLVFILVSAHSLIIPLRVAPLKEKSASTIIV